MCKLTIAQPKGDVICFKIDVITPVVLCWKNTFSLRFILKKFQSQNKFKKKTCLATVKRYVDDIFCIQF